MSEYRCYEFVALDQALGAKEMGQLRKSARSAEVSRTHFWVEQRGRVSKLDPVKLLARYFDAALCFTSQPSVRLLLRLPLAQVDLGRLKAYFHGGVATLHTTASHVIVDVQREFAGDVDAFFARGQLGQLLSLRSALLRGDYGLPYLAWLLAVDVGEVAGARKEPPVPPGLRHPEPALSGFLELSGLDPSLWQAATEASVEPEFSPAALRLWVRGMSERDKDRWLVTALQEGGEGMARELRQAFLQAQQPEGSQRRSAAALRARAAELRAVTLPMSPSEEGEGEESEEERQARLARSRRLGALRRQGARAWARVSRLIATRQYGEAVKLAADLRDALSETDDDSLLQGLSLVRKNHSRRHGYLRLQLP